MSGATDVVADIKQESTWSRIIAEADIIYHLAGNTSSKVAAQNPVDSYMNTVYPVQHLTKQLLKSNRNTRVVYTSTATVYGLTHIFPVVETTIPNPISTYDKHKLCAENELLSTLRKNQNSVVLRLANVYGPSLTDSSAADRGVINRMTKMSLQGNNLYVYGGGGYIRDYIYISDVVNALLIAGCVPGLAGQVYNIGSGRGLSIISAFKTITSKVFEITNVKTYVYSKPWPKDSALVESRNFIADTERFSSITNWNASVEFEDGIIEMIDIFSKNYDNGNPCP
jgi:nucleoside-diphosphate-sugar epimerase